MAFIKKIKAGDYKQRSILENYVRNTFGLNTEIKNDIIIEGKRDELALLNLSDKSIFWGITCKITDIPSENIKFSKPDRGKKTKFGINLEI